MKKTAEIVPPHAASLVESLRAFSYNLPTAVADLVDNSISADSKNVRIHFDWNGAESHIAVIDDGRGMETSELVNAMRLGSRNPLAFRDKNDLGRFGLGMKTASFSQCRRMTVISKHGNGSCISRCWDLDHVAVTDKWELLTKTDEVTSAYARSLEEAGHGTVIVWQQMDRVTGGYSTTSREDQSRFHDGIAAVKVHLGMVFHRIMTGRGAIRLWINDRRVEPWDPYLSDEEATQTLPETKLNFSGSVISIIPYILPHHSKISRQSHDSAAGIHGWNAHQGFYVYRNHRLLVAGDWLGLGWKKEEPYRLARIMVDIPNTCDSNWGVDVTKSKATAPVEFRGELHRIGLRAREAALSVYTHRGAKLGGATDKAREYVWEQVARHDSVSYRINREHSLLKAALAGIPNSRQMLAAIRLIEETVPVSLIAIQNSENPNSLAQPFASDESSIREVMQQAYRALLDDHSPTEAISYLRAIWPFERFPALIDTLLEAHRHD